MIKCNNDTVSLQIPSFIFKYLNPQDLRVAALVCKIWKEDINLLYYDASIHSASFSTLEKSDLKKNCLAIYTKVYQKAVLPPTSNSTITPFPTQTSPLISILSPLPAIEDLYNCLETPQQKRACLCYLLHYQHYNGEFTIAENHRLGYPLPLVAAQKRSIYVRNEAYFLGFLKPWSEKHLKPLFDNLKRESDKIEDYTMFGSSWRVVENILKTLFAKEIQF